MSKLFWAAFSLVLALTGAVPASAATHLKLLAAEAPSGVVTRLRVQILGDDGKPVAGLVTVKDLRVDMGPDKMKDMTTPAKAIPSKDAGVVLVETNLYAPGRWAVIVSGTVGGQSFSGSVVVTAVMKKAEASPPHMTMQKGAALPPPNAARKILYYRNPMGLADTSPVPKKDGMGMPYIAVYADEVMQKPGTIRLTAAKIQRAGVRLSTVRRQFLSKLVRAPAQVAADENGQGVLTARFSGFIEKMYVSQTGDTVRVGQPLMRVWIDSTDVLSKEADYIGALDSHSDKYAAQAAAVLREYGMPGFEIAALAKTRIPKREMTIVAPMSGTVTDKPAIAGMRFASGDTLFRTTDMRRVWVLAQISERDLPQVKVGQSAEVLFRDAPDAKFSGKILKIYPELDSATRTVKARIAVENAGDLLRLGQYADVRINAAVGHSPVLSVPYSAVIDDGSRTVVFVALGGGVFEPRPVRLGVHSGDVIEVRAGLREGDQVVTSGNFLIDAESNLQTALQGFQPKRAAQ